MPFKKLNINSYNQFPGFPHTYYVWDVFNTITDVQPRYENFIFNKIVKIHSWVCMVLFLVFICFSVLDF